MLRWLVWLPVLFLLLRSLATRWFWPALWPGEWSGRAWTAVRLEPLGNSLTLAAGVMVAAVLLAIPLAGPYLRRAAVRWAVMTLALLPPLAASVGLHGLFLRLGLTDSWWGVALVHLIPATPYAVMAVAGSLSRFDEDLVAQARTLGAGRWAIWRHVEAPALAPGLATGAVFAFVISWSQYASTALIGGGRLVTLPMALVGYQQSGDAAVAAALSLMFLGAPVMLSVWVERGWES
jgi:putative spermidine/putrescine transport system permease protein